MVNLSSFISYSKYVFQLKFLSFPGVTAIMFILSSDPWFPMIQKLLIRWALSAVYGLWLACALVSARLTQALKSHM